MDWKKAYELGMSTEVTPEAEEAELDKWSLWEQEVEQASSPQEAQQVMNTIPTIVLPDQAIINAHREKLAHEEQARKEEIGKAFLTVDELLKKPRVKGHIDQVLPLKGLGQIYGKPGVGKTFAIVDLACTLASNKTEWLGLPLNHPEPVHVFYSALEGGSPFYDAVRSWVFKHPEERETLNKYLHILDGDTAQTLRIASTKAMRGGGTGDNLFTIGGWIKDIAGDEPIGMVVADPQMGTLVVTSENDNTEIGEVFTNLRTWANQLDTLVLLVHHSGRGSGEHSRGASSQEAALHVQLSVDYNGIKNRRDIEVVKLKGDLKLENKIVFDLEQIDIGGDRPGAVCAPVVSGLKAAAEKEMANEGMILHALADKPLSKSGLLKKLRENEEFRMKDSAYYNLLNEMIENDTVTSYQGPGTSIYVALP